jgi:hypothetical protein
MSKNERLFRTIVAGIVFAVIGVSAIEYDETIIHQPKNFRGLASANCGSDGCAKLSQAKDDILGARATVLSSHGLDPKEKTTDAIEKEIHDIEDAKLIEAGKALVTMVKAHASFQLDADEIGDVAIFLFDTIDYDASGSALDVLEAGVTQEHSIPVVRDVTAYIHGQSGTSRFSVDAPAKARLKTLLLSLKAYIDEGTPAGTKN